MLNNFPHHLHPMSQLSAACNALQSESKFAKAYAEGVHKSKYWEVRYKKKRMKEKFNFLLIVRL